MLPLGGYQTANPLRDRFVVAFPLKPSEVPSIKEGTTALFQNESGIYHILDDLRLLGAWPQRLVQQEFDRLKTERPTERTSEPVGARWTSFFLKLLCPAVLEDVNRSQIDPDFDP